MTRRLPILMYHRISPLRRESTVKGHYVHPAAFKRQMTLLRLMGYQSIDLLSALDEAPSSKPIVITFDDGYVNFATHALPVLVQQGFTSTVFLVSSLIGQANSWDIVKGDVAEPLMDLATIRRCQESGTSFGSHTMTHADLSACEPAQAWREIAESKVELESLLGGQIHAFCYPYGRKTPEVQQMVRKAGYRLACSTEKGMNAPGTDPFSLQRINVRRDTVLPSFLFKLIRGAR